MSVYKVTFEAVINGFLSVKRLEGVELYEANSYMEAKEKAEAEIKQANDKASFSFATKPVFLIKDIQKVE